MLNKKPFQIMIIVCFLCLCASCAKASPTQVSTPTAQPAASITAVPTNTVTVNVSPAPSATSTSIPPLTSPQGGFEGVGSEGSYLIVMDHAHNTVGIIPKKVYMKVEGPVSLETTPSKNTGWVALTKEADGLYPNATTRFIARPSSYQIGAWGSQLPENWTFISFPDPLLARGDDWEVDRQDDGRYLSGQQTAWSIIQISCAPYDDARSVAGNLNGQKTHTFGIITREKGIFPETVCGNRGKGAITSIIVDRYKLKSENPTLADLYSLMDDAIAHMYSQSVLKPEQTVQEEWIGEATNVAFFIVSNVATGNYQIAPPEWSGAQ